MNSEIIKIVNIDYVKPNPYQPRKTFDEDKLKELSASIKEQGVLQPILVEEISRNNYRIIAGERRYRASKLAELKEIPIIIKAFGTLQKMEVAIIENVQREQLNPIEEAYAYAYLLQEGNLTQEEVAKKIGKSRPAIANSMRLISLPQKIINAILDNTITKGHAIALLSIVNPADRDYLFNEIKEKHLNVRETEIYAQSLNNGARAIKNFRVEKLSSDDIKSISQSKDDNSALSDILNKPLDSEKKDTEDKREKILKKEVEEKFSKAFGTMVKLKGNLSCGKITINYISYDDLERIFNICNKGEDEKLIEKEDF